ncbi:transcriptional repressor NrdR [Candidatus Saccharibacteria bacterium]|nr:transcriptional repressor NrdR [Candidatus Saccharibacteria bacterium]
MSGTIRIGDSKVLESREAPDGSMIRRRREAPDGRRFTTYERIEMPVLTVKKSSGNKEPFDRDKLLTAVQRSVGKFFNSEMEVEDVVNRVTSLVYGYGAEEVTSRQIGEAILEVLAELNEVAYVRFASVFLKFKTMDEFEQVIREQREKKNGNAAGGPRKVEK